MLTLEVDDLLKQLEDYKKRVEKALIKKVYEFTSSWTMQIGDLTPIGDTQKYLGLYIKRKENFGYAIKPGLLMGNWNAKLNYTSFPFNQNAFIPDHRSLTDKLSYTESIFKLGAVINIFNSTPYVNSVTVRGTGEIRDFKQDALAALQSLLQTDMTLRE